MIHLKSVPKWKIVCLFVFCVHTIIVAQCDFVDDYGSAIGWTQVGSGVAVTNGQLEFQNGAANGTERRVYKDLGFGIEFDDCWSARFSFLPTSFGIVNGFPSVEHILFALTSTTQNPGPVLGQSSVALYCSNDGNTGEVEYRVRSYGPSGGAGYGSIINNTLNETIYFELLRACDTLYLSSYSDADYSVLTAGPVVSGLAQIDPLFYVQHANLSTGTSPQQLTGAVDDLCIEWRPECTSHELVLDTSICEGETLIYLDREYTTAGTHIYVHQNFYGCDSIIQFNISLIPPAEYFLDSTLCENESIIIQGMQFDITNPDGEVIFNQGASSGCDSIVYVNLLFIPLASSDFNPIFCQNESVMVNGTLYDFFNPTGVEAFENGASNGCDSMVFIDLLFYPLVEFNIQLERCQDTTLLINGTIYNQSNPEGTEVLQGASETGCDSTINITLDFVPGAEFFLVEMLCETSTIEVNGTIYDINNAQGVEIFAGASSEGCDSLVNINLSFLSSATDSLQLQFCTEDTVVVNGTIYDQYNPSGTEIFSGGAATGCDSTIYISLLFVNEINYWLTDTICSSDSITIIIRFTISAIQLAQRCL